MQQPLKNNADFLVEIHTEELPPRALLPLAENFLTEIKTRLDNLSLHYRDAQFFATPRRLAVLIKKLDRREKDSTIERKGPALTAAFDAQGNPTPACTGFAKSCGITPDALKILKTPQGEWVGYEQQVIGKNVETILPTLIQQSLAALPIAKRMRWGEGTAQFVRPVQSVLMLYGNDIIDAGILGVRTGRLTRGHRFHSSKWITIKSPASYAKTLERHYVMADFAKRRERIRAEAHALIADKPGYHLVMSDALLDEVTGLVEWPVALIGSFDEIFLKVPAEALIAAMQEHQRYFPIVDAQQNLMPFFITISNIESKDNTAVKAGNERVLRARLSDAAFFFETDKKRRLIDRVDDLKHIIFQAKLGTVFEKSERVSQLADFIAKKIGTDHEKAKRAGMLAKTDLTTHMVGEFPELQGIMGTYYALHDGEEKDIAQALTEHYLPRFSGDALPQTPLGAVLALADRIDTLTGIFGINEMPTGDKDPFALRRAALSLLRILIEKKWDLDLSSLLNSAKMHYKTLPHPDVISDVLKFIFDRLKPWYQDQGILPDVFAAVAALNISSPYDFHLRIQAVSHFKKLSEAESLSIANKRVSNILAKVTDPIQLEHIDEKWFEHEAERTLAIQLAKKQQVVSTLSSKKQYTEALSELAGLREPIDHFFDQVMVMAEDKSRRENRLLLLKKLRELFLHIADVALLQ